MAENDPYVLMKSTPVPYDGTDESLVPTLRLLSSTHVVTTYPPYYVIPCAVLVKRPGLLTSTRALFGGNRDNYLPRSGCAWDRGIVEGYPAAAVQSYVETTWLADGNWIKRYQGTNRD